MNWLPEEDFKGVTGDFFDDLMKQLDFPLEDMDAPNAEGDWEARFQDLEPPPMDIFSSSPSEFISSGINKGGRAGIQNIIPPIMKQSSSSAASPNQSSSPPAIKVSKLFQSSSPMSVLESIDGSFSPQNSISQRLTIPVKGIRSKRKRPTMLRLRYLFPFESRKLEKSAPSESKSESSYFSEQPAKKKRKVLPTSLEASNSDVIVRKCTHCETTKTPQWREGPNGPKTLCNACGVRFRSGRLVPEYRPASSPTFIPSMHSNSHRKIIEMRRKDDNQFEPDMSHAVISGA